MADNNKNNNWLVVDQFDLPFPLFRSPFFLLVFCSTEHTHTRFVANGFVYSKGTPICSSSLINTCFSSTAPVIAHH